MTAVLLLGSCSFIERYKNFRHSKSIEYSKYSKEKKTIYDDGYYHFIRIVIEGHDYTYGGVPSYGHESFVHSGSCRKCKQERDSINNEIIKAIKENGK